MRKVKAICILTLVALDILVMLYSSCHMFNSQLPFVSWLDMKGCVVTFIISFLIYCYLRWDSDGKNIGVQGVVIALIGLLLAIYGGSHILIGHIQVDQPVSNLVLYYGTFIIGIIMYAYYDYKACVAYENYRMNYV